MSLSTTTFPVSLLVPLKQKARRHDKEEDPKMRERQKETERQRERERPKNQRYCLSRDIILRIFRVSKARECLTLKYVTTVVVL